MMQIDLQSQSLALDAEVARRIRRQASEALAHTADHIHHVSLHLADINGRKGGLDKQCHLIVHLNGLPAVVVRETRGDLADAIARALRRAQFCLSRRVGRHRQVSGHPVTADHNLWSLA